MATNLIPGATGKTLTLTNVQKEKDGYGYYCVATNAYGSDQSATAVLTVNDVVVVQAPVAKPTPLSSNAPLSGVKVGDSVTITMELFEGSFPLNYIWKKNEGTLQTNNNINNLSNFITTTMVKNTDFAGIMTISCEVTNGAGTSGEYTINIDVDDVPIGTAPVITTNLQSTKDVNQGQPLELTIQATGNPSPTYTWWKVDETVIS